MIITYILCSLLLLGFVGIVIYQRFLIRRTHQLAEQAEQSKQQMMAEQARNRQLKQEMTNNIAHELKTPVASIRGYLEILLSDKPLTDEKRHYFLDRCYQQTLRLSDLINDVSLINKLEEADDLFPQEPINLHAIAEEAIHELEDKAQAQQSTLRNLLPHDMTITGNHSLAYCIFRNLMENSLNHAGEGIEIALRCYKEDADRVYLHFYDTGCGVDNLSLDKLFDRFVRLDEGRSRKTGGTGLGLSIVKHAVLFHGGSIYAKNRDTSGLEFYFSMKKGG
ncbi:MAG: hypothetical protein HUK17_06265 [Bacteroidales bacterium]|nr:hypothetical protein [Bacteroidales bacterium]